MLKIEDLREQIPIDGVFNLLEEFGGEPAYANSETIIALTIDHNNAHEGSRKLYYYDNTKMLTSYTVGSTFDIVQLVIDVFSIQKHQKISVPQAINFLAVRFGIDTSVELTPTGDGLEDWKILENYDRIESITAKNYNVVLKEYDSSILSVFDHTAIIRPWLDEGIPQEQLDKYGICYYSGGNQIVIPHYDINGRLIGIRGRTLSEEDAQLYGKYRPLVVNGEQFQHPLSLNAYNLNFAKDSIKRTGTVIVFESEKSCLKADAMGIPNTIAVCGSAVSDYTIHLLIENGARNIVLALDRDFTVPNAQDKAWIKLTKTYERLNKKYSSLVNLSFIVDKNMITGLHHSPVDDGKEKFEQLYRERVRL